MADDNIDNTAGASLQDVYGEDEESPKPSRLKATISSLRNNPLKKKPQRKINMVRADDPPKVDNDAEARSIRVHHTESSPTYAEVLADEMLLRGTIEGAMTEDRYHPRGILGTEGIHSSSSSNARGILNDDHLISPTGFIDTQPHPGSLKDANNLDGKYPMQPTDEHPQGQLLFYPDEHLQNHLLSSKSCYQVLNFDNDIDFATIDRGANHGLAGMSMVPIMLTNKYVNVKALGGISSHDLRLGDFKSVLTVRDPKDDTDHEVMCIFRNYGCHINPEERMKTSSIHPALQLEERGIIIEDQLKSQRRITLPDGTFADIHLREGIPCVPFRRPTDQDNHLQTMELTCPNWDPSIFDFSHEDDEFESNIHSEGYDFNYIEPYMYEGYGLESPGTSSPDSTIHVTRSHFEHSVLPLLRRYRNQAIEESSLVLYHFDFEEGIPCSLSSWILYCIKNGEFIQGIRHMEATYRDAVLEGYNVKGRSMYKEKLNRRLKYLAPLHGFVQHATRIHRMEWTMPDHLPREITGRDHSEYTIVIHPLLADHLRAYQFEERDVIEGMLFGDEDLYINASQHNLRNHVANKRYRKASNRREYTDYRVTLGICNTDGVFCRDRNANRTPHIGLNNTGPKGNICNVNRRNESIATDTVFVL